MPNQIKSKLFALQDLKYKDFQSSLMPTVNSDTVIGVRTPELRKYAKELSKDGCAAEFLRSLPHEYYEENNLHAFLIEQVKDFEQCIEEINRFLPYIDNWFTCDTMRPKCFKKHADALLSEIETWISSSHTYTVRFGIGMLMAFHLDENFDKKYLDWVAAIRSEEYYVNMMIAWYFATALAKQHEAALPYLEEERLPLWVHNKTIQKAVESYRITDEQKRYLRSLKRMRI